MAEGTFVGMARGDGISMVMPAARATEPFRLALLRQRLITGFFRSIPFLPAQQICFRRFHGPISRLVDPKQLGR